MFLEEYQLIIGVIIAVGGWYVGHLLSWRREQNKKARETRLNYLRVTYKDMTRLRSYASVLSIEEIASLLIGVISDIELLGTESQVSIARELSEVISEKKGTFDRSSDLIDSLRDDLRTELRLSTIPTPVQYFNYKKKRLPTSQEYIVESTGERISVPIKNGN